jgi:hypothetical protein
VRAPATITETGRSLMGTSNDKGCLRVAWQGLRTGQRLPTL